MGVSRGPIRTFIKMPEPQIDTTGSPIKEFIEQARKQAEAGVGNWEFKAPLDLELSTIVSGKAGGGIDIKVVNFGANVQAEQIQKIKTSIGPKDKLEQTIKRTKLMEAKRKEKYEKSDFDTTFKKKK